MKTTTDAVGVPAYVSDIQAQPEALQRFLDAELPADARRVLRRLDDFDRVVMTGMGASLFGQYPGYLRLVAAGKPVWLVETAELLGAARGLITGRTLVWVVSQSGATAEVVQLLADLTAMPATVLAVTNDLASPLAAGADLVLELHSGAENTVGTRSYVNTLAAVARAVGVALDQPVDAALAAAPAALSAYLRDWGAHCETLGRLVSDGTTFVLGRGASLAAASTGALILKEAAGRPVEGMSVPQFRHGPLEMVGPEVTVVLLAGDPVDHAVNRVMEHDLRSFGAEVVWVDAATTSPTASMPDLPGTTVRPIAEILPLQLLSVALADRAGQEPGAFTKIGKITRTL